MAMADPIRPRATIPTHPTVISNPHLYIKGLHLPPTTPPAIAPTLDDLCDTCSEDGKDDVDEDEAVEDGGTVRVLMTVVGAGAVDSGSEGETLQYVKKPHILNHNTPVSCMAAYKSKVSFESGK